jgi:hypothetical protein
MILHFATMLSVAVPALAGLGPVKTVPHLADASASIKAAQEAEKQGDFAKALQLYEDILDSGRTPTVTTSRAILYAKLGELRPKVAPNTDPAKAGVWKVKALVFRKTDVRHKDDKGKDLHSVYKFRDDEIEGIRKAMKGFSDLVWKYTDGNLRIAWTMEIVEQPLTSWDGYPGFGCCGYALKNLKRGDADSVFAYAKATGDANEKSDPLPWSCLAGTMGAFPETKLASWIGFNCGAGNCTGGDGGEVQLHEWLHAVDMTFGWVQAYGDLLDWTSDGGGTSELWGSFKLKEGEKYWLPFYEQIMRQYVTRKMWRELSATRRSNNPWLNPYVRDMLVRGPFPAKGNGFDKEFIDETTIGKQLANRTGRRLWKQASAPGKYVCFADALGELSGDEVVYAAFTVESDKDRPAQIWSQRDGGLKLWHDGRLVYASPVNREWWNKPNVVDVQLKKGANLFVMKLTNARGDWAFNTKVTDMGGNWMPEAKIGMP